MMGRAFNLPEDLDFSQIDSEESPEAFLAHVLESDLEIAVLAAERDSRIFQTVHNVDEVFTTQYHDRTLIELVQNAHDARDDGERGEIEIRLDVGSDVDAELYVANRGKGFNSENVQAIRNLATSSKAVGAGIGNKGLGFRSVESLSKDPHIYSQDGPARRAPRFLGFCFRFLDVEETEKRLLARGCNPQRARTIAAMLPRYLMSSPVTEQSDSVRSFAEAGYATVVVLPLRTAAAVAQAKSQLHALLESDAPLMLFLDRLQRVRIRMNDRGTETVVDLTRRVEPLGNVRGDDSATYGFVDLGKRGKYCMVRQRLDKTEVLRAVEASIESAPQLRNWLGWKGDATVSIAAPLDSRDTRSTRLYNFLPMGAETLSPMPCFVDAPFFTDIDRRNTNLFLPLNAFLIDAVADACVRFVLAVGRDDARIPQQLSLDLVSWSALHLETLKRAFAKAGDSFSDAPVIPAIARRGDRRWTSLRNAVCWSPEPFSTVEPRRLVDFCDAPIVAKLSPQRLANVARLVGAVAFRGTNPSDSQLAGWIEALARNAASSSAKAHISWSALYDELPRVFKVFGCDLASLKGRAVLVERGKRLGVAGRDATGRMALYRGRERSDAERVLPLPPATVSRKLRFIDDAITLAAETVVAFKNANLLREYDAIEALNSLAPVLSRTSGEVARVDALAWAFRLWRAAPQQASQPLRKSRLKVPTREGWTDATEAMFSAGWTSLGRTLEPFLIEMTGTSEDCESAALRLTVEFVAWPCQVRDASKKQWQGFLETLGVTDGLRPCHSDAPGAQRGMTWNIRMMRGNASLGCSEAWCEAVGSRTVYYPNTDYDMRGHLWRFPGQIEYGDMSTSARERMSDLIVGYLSTDPRPFFEFTIGRFERSQSSRDVRTLPTPLAVFLKAAPWLKVLVGGEAILSHTTGAWGSSIKNRTPRFVPHVEPSLNDEIAEAEEIAGIYFGSEIGLKDWSLPSTAPLRVTALADCFEDLASSDRKRFRSEYRRAWSEVASLRLQIASDTRIVIRRFAAEEVVFANALPEPVLVSDDENSLRAKALTSVGRSLLAVQEGETDAVVDALVGSSIPAVRLENVTVRLLVDGEPFVVPRSSDPPLLTPNLEWLSRLLLLAHDAKADGFERGANSVGFDQRLRSIRTRFCASWALNIDDRMVIPEDTRVYVVDDPLYPTLVIAGVVELDWSSLLDSAAHISRLIDSRLRTFEWALLRLNVRMRELRTPTDDELARAVGIDPSVVREYAASASTGDESMRRLLPGLIGYYFGLELGRAYNAAALKGNADIRTWMMRTLAADRETVEKLLSAAQDADSSSDLLDSLELNFENYNRILLELGEPPLNDEMDLRRQFSAFVAELRPSLVDELRAHHLDNYRSGRPLAAYTAQKTLEFITFDPKWLVSERELNRSIIEDRARACLNAEIGRARTMDHRLAPLGKVLDANRAVVRNLGEALRPLVRAWCVKSDRSLPPAWSALDSQILVRELENQGLLDFDAVAEADVPQLLARAQIWPREMPTAASAELLGLDERDVHREEQKRREQIEESARRKRSVSIAGQALDTAAPDFAQQFVAIAEGHRERPWFASLRTVRLRPLDRDSMPRKRERGDNGGPWRGGKNASDQIKRAMGLFGEWLAYEYLKHRHPLLADETCWLSSNRTYFCGGSEGDDTLGFDFRIRTATAEWLYEVKAAVDDVCEFEFTANEMTKASGASGDRRRKYRILYVPYVFDPKRWTVLELPNPMGESTQDRYRIVGRASARMRFDLE